MNELTFGRETKFEEDLKATASAGFRAIEIAPQKLADFAKEKPLARAKELLDGFHLKAAGLCGYSLGAFSKSEASLEAFEQGIKLAGSIDTNIILVYFDRPSVDMPKERVSITIRRDLLEWIDQKVESLRFASRSHALEYAIAKLKQEEGSS